MADKTTGIGRRVGGALGGVFDRAMSSVGEAGKLLGEAFRLPNRTRDQAGRLSMVPGDAAGIEHEPDIDTPPSPGSVRLVCIDYAPDRIERCELRTVEDLDDHARPDWAAVRWLRVEGLHPYVVNDLRERHDLHTLAAEDVLHVPQRARVDAYDDHLFVVSQMVTLRDGELHSQQISFFVMQNLLLTFQEEWDDSWQPIEARLDMRGSRLREADASYLAYALLDVIVDHGFPVLEQYAERLEQLEDAILERPDPDLLQEIHSLKRELTVLRRLFFPMRELISSLAHEEQVMVSDETRTFLGDVHDHSIQIIDMVETFRDLSSSLTELYLSMSSHRMTEVMQVLTVIATIFIPITFLAGVYGMNFHYLPELHWRYGYAAFWLVCCATVGGLLWYFRQRGWFGGR